jgi:hypothetical protein
MRNRSAMTATARLPDPVRELLNGRELIEKVGHTFLLIACEPDGWPRMAMLSVGEVLAVSGREVRLALYSSSGTTKALTQGGKALLVVVLDGVTYKIRLLARLVDPAGSDSGSNALFVTSVDRVDEDLVDYATVEHGIEFSLVDEGAVVERWIRAIDRLEALL